MLAALTIRNLAVVDSIDLEFGPGMSVLTGETGAGKSILVDAIGLVLGDRTDNGMIRAGCERAEITATFTVAQNPDALGWLAEHEIGHDGDCILRRVLVRDGRSRAFINGSPVTIADLGAIGSFLLDIHGQHAHQSLTRRAYQRALLDAFGGHEDRAAAVAAAFRELRDIRRRLAEVRTAAEESGARLDLLRFQLRELEALDPQPGEWRVLEAEHRRLSHAGEIRESCESLLGALFDEDGAENRLQQAARLLEGLTDIDPGLRESGEMVQSALIQVQEARPALRHYADAVELDPERLQQVDERITAIHALSRKYRFDPDAPEVRLAELREQIATIDNADAQIERLAAAATEAEDHYRKLCGQLRRKRKSAAAALGREITTAMQQLNMQGGRFSVRLEPVAADEAGAHGSEQVEFHVTANPGQPQQPLAQVASGGELSRISLAIQVAAAECTHIPTLIFDEVDVGIGGGVAEIVGRLLRAIGQSRQVMCVTHLAQVAAQARHHLRVEKLQDGSSTHTSIAPLDAEERVAEIARMLGGMKITKQTQAHAREMIRLAGS